MWPWVGTSVQNPVKKLIVNEWVSQSCKISNTFLKYGALRTKKKKRRFWKWWWTTFKNVAYLCDWKIIFVDAMCVSSALSIKRKSHFTPREIESSYICGFQACAASRNCSYLLYNFALFDICRWRKRHQFWSLKPPCSVLHFCPPPSNTNSDV